MLLGMRDCPSSPTDSSNTDSFNINVILAPSGGRKRGTHVCLQARNGASSKLVTVYTWAWVQAQMCQRQRQR